MQKLFNNCCANIDCIRVKEVNIKNWTVYLIVVVLFIWELMSIGGAIWFIAQVNQSVFTGLEIIIIFTNILNLIFILFSLIRYICCGGLTKVDEICRIFNIIFIILGLIFEAVTMAESHHIIANYISSQYFVVDIAILAGLITNAILYAFLYYLLSPDNVKN